jgi:hypothetical protein
MRKPKWTSGLFEERTVAAKDLTDVLYQVKEGFEHNSDPLRNATLTVLHKARIVSDVVQAKGELWQPMVELAIEVGVLKARVADAFELWELARDTLGDSFPCILQTLGAECVEMRRPTTSPKDANDTDTTP